MAFDRGDNQTGLTSLATQDVTIVAADLAGANTIGTVATNIADVNTVASNIGIVNDVADNETNINAVNSNSSNINTVAGNNTNVTTVAGISGNVTTVAGISSNVTTVATNIANVNTTATNIANVNTVATNISNVNAVAGNATNINAVAGNATNINSVAGNATNINAVAGNATNINTVATNIADVNTVADALAVPLSAASAVSYSGTTSKLVATNVQTAIDETVAKDFALADARIREAFRKEKSTTIAPSLLLDFSGDKILDPRITFTRTTEARYYDGKTVAKAEENLGLYSQDFTQAYWTSTLVAATLSSVAGTAPDGSGTVGELTETATSSNHRVTQGSSTAIQFASGASYCFSIYLKAGTATIVQLTVSTAIGTGYANFDISVGGGASGTVTASSGVTASISSLLSNDWYRCSIVFTSVATATTGGVIVTFTNNNPTATRLPSYLGTGMNCYIWGAQAEQRSAVTAYTPTTTQPITNYIPVLQTAASGQARFDHNPVTGESLGLLIEEQRTNIQTYSSQFNGGGWTFTRASAQDNVVIAPDGTLTGGKLIENTETGTHQLKSASLNTYGTFSIYAKAAERSKVKINWRNNPNNWIASAVFNLANGTIDSIFYQNSTGSNSPSIVPVGNGWYRVSLYYSLSNTDFFKSPEVRIVDNSGNDSYTGDGYSGIYIWGAQLENTQLFPTSYIPTTSASVTRNADAASMTGTNFSSWYRADEGTVYCSGISNKSSSDSTTSVFVAFDDGTTANSILIDRAGGTNNMRIAVTTNSVTQSSLIFASIASQGLFVSAANSYKVNDFAGVANGLTVQTDNSGIVPKVSIFSIGQFPAGNRYFGGTIRKIAYYPSRLPNATIQSITT